MAKKYTRQEFMNRLWATVKSGNPLAPDALKLKTTPP